MKDDIVLLETNLDDCTGEVLGYVMEELLALGARDVWYTPIFMKKGRPAYALSVLCKEPEKEACIKLIFRETTAIGLRVSNRERVVMDRETVTVETPYGAVAGKHLTYEDVEKTSVEYEDAKRLAKENGVPLASILKFGKCE